MRSHFLPGVDTPDHCRSASAVLGPRNQFPLGSPAFPLFPFYETTIAPVSSIFFLLFWTMHYVKIAMLPLTPKKSGSNLNQIGSLRRKMTIIGDGYDGI